MRRGIPSAASYSSSVMARVSPSGIQPYRHAMMPMNTSASRTLSKQTVVVSRSSAVNRSIAIAWKLPVAPISSIKLRRRTALSR